MKMNDLKEYLKNNGEDYYSKILASKIIDKIEVFLSSNTDKKEYIQTVSEVIKQHIRNKM